MKKTYLFIFTILVMLTFVFSADRVQAAGKISIDYPFEERFVYGNKNLFYIEDDGSLTCEFRGKEDQTIEYGTGADGLYFILVNEGNGSQTLYFLNRDRQLSYTPIGYPEEMYVSCITIHNGLLYYSGYDRNEGKDVIYYYDPQGDAFNDDPEADRLVRYFENYKGRGLNRLNYYFDLVRDMEEAGCIYMKDPDSGDICVFDAAGKEIKTFKTEDNLNDIRYYGPGYLVAKVSRDESEAKKTEGGQKYALIDTGSGKTFHFTLGKAPDEAGIADFKDGYIYYYVKLFKNGVETGRDYRRLSVYNIRNGSPADEFIVRVDQYPCVDCSYGSYTEGNNGYDAFTIKDDRAYYLVFDEEGTDGRRGDVVWRSVPLKAPSEKDIQKTGAMERHESFADYGTVSAEAVEKKAEEEDDFVYFAGSYQSFRFNKDTKNAAKLNSGLEKIDKDFREMGDEIAESARKEIIEEGEEGNNVEWFREFIGRGYTYDQTFGEVQEVSKDYIQVTFDDYAYFGGAHGTGSSYHYLFDTKTGERKTFDDLYEGTEEEFKTIAFNYSMSDWKNNSDPYYYVYTGEDGTEAEETMKGYFKDNISLDMNISFTEGGIYLCYPPYAVGPYASGEIQVYIPYYALDIEV
ncbi:MAG: RsiV family protein [Lachnospiraceae bacterium]|nr:RsiV family protein [Lachnospiraceae bacterium]